MITNLIDKFSKGSIEIKFRIVTPLTPNKKRKAILLIGTIIVLAFTFYIIPITLYKWNIFTTISYAIGLGFLWLFYDLLTKKLLFQIKSIGIIKFLSDTIEIKLTDNSLIETFEYSEIKGIKYKFNVPKTVIARTPPAKTYIIEFVRYDNPTIVVEVECDIYLTKDDLNQKRTIEPNIKTVFSYLTPKYGIECVNNITMPK